MEERLLQVVRLFIVLPLICLFVRMPDGYKAFSTNDIQIDNGVTPINEQFDHWPFLVNYTYASTQYRNKLKLSKSFIELDIKSEFTGEMPFLKAKVSFKEHLLRCDNLTLSSSAVKEQFDCRPIQSYILLLDNDDVVSDYNVAPKNSKYVKRITLKIKHRNSLISDDKKPQEYILYPLVEDFTSNRIKSLTEFLNLTKPLNFQKPIQIGYYFEAIVGDKKTDNFVTCSGELYMSTNATKPILSDRVPNDLFPELADKYSNVIRESIDNGYLFSIQNVNCRKPGIFEFITLGTNFTIVQKNDFPYMTLSHSTWVEPNKGLLNYEAIVKQELNSISDDNSAYNTTVNIRSKCLLISWLDFQLSQTFTNNDFQSGFEEMVLVGKRFALSVGSSWNETGFDKMAKLFLYNLDNMGSEGEQTVTRSLMVLVDDKKSEDELGLYVRVRRDLAKLLFGYSSKFLDEENEERNEARVEL